MQKEKSTRR